MAQLRPVQLEVFRGGDNATRIAAGYQSAKTVIAQMLVSWAGRA